MRDAGILIDAESLLSQMDTHCQDVFRHLERLTGAERRRELEEPLRNDVKEFKSSRKRHIRDCKRRLCTLYSSSGWDSDSDEDFQKLSDRPIFRRVHRETPSGEESGGEEHNGSKSPLSTEDGYSSLDKDSVLRLAEAAALGEFPRGAIIVDVNGVAQDHVYTAEEELIRSLRGRW